MTRYFFNLRECGTVTWDREGALLPDVPAARDHAIHEARAIMAAEVLEGRLCLHCNIEVLDAAGGLAVNLPFGEALIVTGG